MIFCDDSSRVMQQIYDFALKNAGMDKSLEKIIKYIDDKN